MIEFDVETTGLQPYSGNNEAFLWIFSDGTDHEAIPFSPSGAPIEAWDIRPSARWRSQHTLEEAAENANAQTSESRKKVHARIQRWFDKAKADPDGIRAWNAKFDRGFAVMAGCFDLPGDGKWHDGMLVAHAVDERRSVALKNVSKQLFGDEAAAPQVALKDWLNAENRRRQKAAREAGEEEYVRANYSHVPREIMEPYAIEDVVLTKRVSDVYDQTLAQKPDLKSVYEFERKTMDALFAVEMRGLPVKENGVEYRRLEQEVISNLEGLEARVHELAMEADPVIYAKQMAGDKWGEGGHMVEVDETGMATTWTGGAARLDQFNPNSTAQILACLKARGADMSYMSEKDGKLSADAENLRAVDDELAAAILEFRSEYKVLSTYVRPMIGRSYVSAMNVYKEPFIAPDSRIHATYRQVGARTGRMSCADPNMQNQPRDDLRLRYNIVADPGYSLITCDLSNIEMVLFAAYCGEGRLLDAVRNGEDLHVLTAKMLGLRDRKRPGGGVETARQLGKTYNFSRIYGGGLRTIKRSFRCSMDEARLLKRRFDDAYPEVARLTTRIEYRLQDDGYIQDKLISGRRFRVDPREAYKATNYLIQGTAAALLKYAVVKLHEDGVPMVALVHDEIVAHVPTSEAEAVAKQIETRMTEFPGLQGVVPLRADADIVNRWSDAKKLKDEDGNEYMFTPQWAGGEKRYVA
jgi:DNA polymerase I-like protein with 3'-5' exonuclease and polymerase domains